MNLSGHIIYIEFCGFNIAKDRPNSSEKHEKSETQKSSKRSKKDHSDKHNKHEKDGGSRSSKPRSNLPKSQSQQTVNDSLTVNFTLQFTINHIHVHVNAIIRVSSSFLV